MKKTVAGGLSAVLGLAVLAACGSGSDDGSSQAGGNADECVAAAKKIVDAGRADVTPFLPDEPVDASKAKGKTVWMIQSTVTPLVTAVTNGFKASGKDAGINIKVVNGNGSIPTTVGAVSQAIAQKADGIVLFAIATTAVEAQVKEAKAAGIPVVDTYNSNIGTDLTASGFFGHVSADYAQGGKEVAAWMMADSKCDVDTAIMGNAALQPHKAQRDAALGELKECGGSCKGDYITLDLPKLATIAGPEAQQALRRDPNMKYIYSLLDGAVTFIAPSVQQSGRTDVKVASMGGDTASLERIRSGKSIHKAVVAIPPQAYQGYAFMDQILRAMTGGEAVDWKLTTRFIDETNVGKSDAEIFPQFDGVEAKFNALWGLN
ncbi:MAG: Sugar transporter substrate-binding protein [Aeromicrobium sp.]|uniref:sugar ABC transporter substrate-binding protein n=1 Tax=Aeromicrobium sp. TaxID=1871063 RepID=UPI00260DBD05|nr:sugar ABC transporter substrate-binding protein [Aeromicrobium sp.]MCW2826364.1 Sugar transporter substrate-binding protein [Aeromicrobium sp.]